MGTTSDSSTFTPNILSVSEAKEEAAPLKEETPSPLMKQNVCVLPVPASHAPLHESVDGAVLGQMSRYVVWGATLEEGLDWL